MTTEEPRRRQDDVDAQAVFDAVMSLQEALDARFSAEWARADEIHLGFATKVHDHPEIHLLVNALEGTPKAMPSGAVVREGGLISEVAGLTEVMKNGGLRIKIPPMAWAAIWAAIIGGVFNLVAVLLN